MNEQNSGGRFNTWDVPERRENDTNGPVANRDPLTDEVPVEAVLIHETPMGETVAAVGPLDATIAGEAPMAEAMPYEAPVGEPVADESGVSKPMPYVAPMEKTIVGEAAMAEAMPYKAPVSEPVADESGVSKPMPYVAPMDVAITHEAPIGTNAGSSAALLNREESEHFRTRWNEIQGKFVDEPRSAVQQADALVSEVVEQITRMFANEHSSLESQWKQGNDVSTEDLRKALQRYRSFFNRLVV